MSLLQIVPPYEAKAFTAPRTSFSDLGAEDAAKLIEAAADIALVLDRRGIIEDISLSSELLAKEGYAAWLGRPWIDTVTTESRKKIREMVEEVTAKDVKPRTSRWREVNHPTKRGSDIAIRYSVVQAGKNGRLVAVGRDLSAMTALQQRLIEIQQAMEREYARIRAAETRYRLLFQLASEAVLIIDASTQKVIDANPVAMRILNRDAKRLSGLSFLDLFEPESLQAVQSLLGAVRATGRAEDMQARLAGEREQFWFSASLFRQESATYFLVRLTQLPHNVENQPLPKANAALLTVIDSLPEGFVVTDPNRRILTANAAFLDLAQLASVEQARGELLERWVGRASVDVDVLMANLREHGSVRHFASLVRGEYGSSEEVEITAVAVPGGPQPCFGLTLRTRAWRTQPTDVSGRAPPPAWVAQFTELVGRVSLKDLIREATDMIERLCIEAALQLTRDNRASAAEMLGLSRQSLYSKMHRYSLGDLDGESDGGS
jgi:transcriptional regulator PpsR